MKFDHPSTLLASLSLAIASFTSVSALTTQFTESAIAQQAAPAVTTKSGAREIALAKHLRKIGAKLYTAYWCPYCHKQQQRFGVEANRQLEVIECDARGVRPQVQACRSKGIRSYPSWEINGKIYPGNQPLENLARFSQFRDRW
ncbi:MAG: hypothetical protein AUK48_10700 [Oscillatoriales cyanobacterium CG2_30_44_21]|nr:MAG: hypothetical protein AUK48_10700 [Oscillatoriales cyanobacterium CG2_30_44_21]